LIILGAVSIAIVLIMPRGLWGFCRRIFRADLIPIVHAPVVGRAGCVASPSLSRTK
jgi:hypothetical protein